ncbi:MAG: hypothetical protein R3246_10475, partial [Acidimicrobiia bacterium]|nr:hypothetical protein [Acidimicrobiia bacterium]
EDGATQVGLDHACLAAVEILLDEHPGRQTFDDAILAMFSDDDTRTSLRHHQTLLALRAGLDARAGRHEDVAKASGAIEVVRAATGNAVRWDLRRFLSDAEAMSRDALGDSAFDATRTHATELTPEQVTAFLLGRNNT